MKKIILAGLIFSFPFLALADNVSTSPTASPEWNNFSVTYTGTFNRLVTCYPYVNDDSSTLTNCIIFGDTGSVTAFNGGNGGTFTAVQFGWPNQTNIGTYLIFDGHSNGSACNVGQHMWGCYNITGSFSTTTFNLTVLPLSTSTSARIITNTKNTFKEISGLALLVIIAVAVLLIGIGWSFMLFKRHVARRKI